MDSKQRFINACLNKEVDRPPVWMMRQAGRYLPEYRAVKEKHGTKEMMQTPEIACEITIQPVDIIGTDAAILYSDILMIPDAMGMGLRFSPGEGPVFDFLINTEDALNKLNTQHLNERLSYVFQSIALCLKKLPEDYPLLGFAGAPFTVACYMMSGGHAKDFAQVKKLAWTEPKIFHGLMEILTTATIDYVLEQGNGGVTAIQIFDSWAGVLSKEDYAVMAKPYTERVFKALKDNYIPSIHYIKGSEHLLEELKTLPSDVISIDWRTSLGKAKQIVGSDFALQGNIDPDVLLSNPELIKERIATMMQSIGNPKKGYIANLGHGIGKDTPVANAKAFIDGVKNYF
ncbi:MAG: uroporphyrinogen decarboxylase [Deltaproteobacteria bacterium]|nr:uroporphyrinogen decarboxylase [Deltaproteobacteria bacterium]